MVTESGGAVSFSGTATGNITVAFTDTVATFSRGGLTATTTPDFATATKITLASGQTLSDTVADVTKFHIVDGAGNLTITDGASVAAIGAINFSGVTGTVSYTLLDSLADIIDPANSVIVDAASGYSLTDAFATLTDPDNSAVFGAAETYTLNDAADSFTDVLVADALTTDELAALTGAENAADYDYTIADSLDAIVTGGADVNTAYSLSDAAGLLAGLSVAEATVLAGATDKANYTYSISDSILVANGLNFTTTDFTGTTGVTLTGSAGNQTVTGSANADNITGGGGADVLTGGAGADVFTYTDSATEIVTYAGTNTDTSNIEKITDFLAGTDTFRFDVGSTFASLLLNSDTGITVNKSAGGFSYGAAPISVDTATVTTLTQLTAAMQAIAPAAVSTTGVAGDATGLQIYTFATTGGSFGGKSFLVINDATAPIAATDVIIEITGVSGNITATDFIIS